MKKLLPLIFSIITLSVCGQKQGNIWFFGQGDGISFASGSPVNISGGQTGTDGTEAQEGTSSISDSNGHILFYSGGETVWNRFNQPMPNGTGLMGGISSTEAALIVPLPGSSEYFYLFTTDEFQSYVADSGKGLRYSIIDMCLDNSKGDIIPGSKNIWLMDSTSEKLCAVADSQGTGYWIMGRKWFTDEFYAWHLTAAGITDTVISHADTGVVFTGGSPSGQGQMKFSSDGTKLAYVTGNYQPPLLSVFDFNSATGVVSNKRSLNIDTTLIYSDAFGLEFSPDGTKLYASEFEAIFQYDLVTGGGTAASINASRYPTYTPPPGYENLAGLQLGPDSNIYVVIAPNAVGVIRSPNLFGAGAVYQDSVLILTNPNNYSFPSFIAGYAYSNGTIKCQARLALARDSFTILQGSVDTLNVTANDTIPPGDSVCITLLNSPTHFSVLNCTSIIYHPDSSFTGCDTCVYVLCDTAHICDTSTVVVNVYSASQLPIAEFVQDSVNINQNGQLFGPCQFPNYPFGLLTFELYSTSRQSNSVSWTITDIYSWDYTFDSVAYFYGDTIFINPSHLWNNNNNVDWGPQTLSICITAYNQYGSTTYCDTTCFIAYEGITEVPLANIRLYPSPASSSITIDMQQCSSSITSTYTSISLYDALGQRVRSIPRQGSSKVVYLSVASMPDGIYLATITDDTGTEMMLGKFVVVK